MAIDGGQDGPIRPRRKYRRTKESGPGPGKVPPAVYAAWGQCSSAELLFPAGRSREGAARGLCPSETPCASRSEGPPRTDTVPVRPPGSFLRAGLRRTVSLDWAAAIFVSLRITSAQLRRHHLAVSRMLPSRAITGGSPPSLKLSLSRLGTHHFPPSPSAKAHPSAQGAPHLSVFRQLANRSHTLLALSLRCRNLCSRLLTTSEHSRLGNCTHRAAGHALAAGTHSLCICSCSRASPLAHGLRAARTVLLVNIMATPQ